MNMNQQGFDFGDGPVGGRQRSSLRSADGQHGTPFYQSERVVLYLGDCRDAVSLIEADSCGVLVTDPPYGVEWRSSFRTEALSPIAGDDGSLDVPAILGEYTTRIRSHRHVYVFGYTPDDLRDKMRLSAPIELIWDKDNIGLGDLALPWGPQHERITFGVHVRSEANRRDGKGTLSAKLRQGSVIRVPRPNSGAVKKHPTEKPVALMWQLIESSTVRDDIVLDPFAGTGSTLVAAVLLGRRAIGVELEQGYAEEAVRRIQHAERIADEILTI